MTVRITLVDSRFGSSTKRIGSYLLVSRALFEPRCLLDLWAQARRDDTRIHHYTTYCIDASIGAPSGKRGLFMSIQQ